MKWWQVRNQLAVIPETQNQYVENYLKILGYSRNSYLFNPLELHYDSFGRFRVEESFFYLIKKLSHKRIDGILIIISLVRSNRQAFNG